MEKRKYTRRTLAEKIAHKKAQLTRLALAADVRQVKMDRLAQEIDKLEARQSVEVPHV
jgi:hypothetical protein